MHDHLSPILFFQEPLGFLIGAIFEILIGSIFTIQFMDFSTFGEAISQIVAYFTVSLYLIVGYPSLLWIQTRTFEEMQDSDIQKRYSILFQSVKYKNKLSRMYYLVYMLRRTVLVVFFLFIRTPIYQLIVLFSSNWCSLIYIGSVRPNNSPLENRLDFLNELMIMIISFMAPCFTPWIDDSAFQYHLGWVIIGLTLLTLILNLIHVFYHVIRFLIMVYRKLSNMYIRYVNKRR